MLLRALCVCAAMLALGSCAGWRVRVQAHGGLTYLHTHWRPHVAEVLVISRTW